MQLLVAEDDPRVATFLVESLKADGHDVRACRTLGELADFLEAGTDVCEVAILDRMLRGEDSLSLLPKFKTQLPGARVLILSALNSADEKAKALDLGADDYLAKPFSLVELSARLRALSRRATAEPAAQTVLTLSNVCVDLLSHQTNCDGQRLDLSNKEFQLLACLIKNPGRVFNKFQLLDRVWNVQSDIESNVVESTVRNLRRKLEDAGARLEVKSRRNVGYWIEGLA